MAAPDVGLPGDYNNDGTVDAADYTVWRDGLVSGQYTHVHYDIWKQNFGVTALGAGTVTHSAASPAVPEPSAVVLLAFAWFVLGAVWRTGR